MYTEMVAAIFFPTISVGPGHVEFERSIIPSCCMYFSCRATSFQTMNGMRLGGSYRGDFGLVSMSIATSGLTTLSYIQTIDT